MVNGNGKAAYDFNAPVPVLDGSRYIATPIFELIKPTPILLIPGFTYMTVPGWQWGFDHDSQLLGPIELHATPKP